MACLRRLGGYREYPPPPDLEAMVDAVWIYARPAPHAPPIPGSGHRVLPDAGVSLCFECRRGVGGRVSAPRLLLMGPIRTVRFFRPGAGLHLEAVRLKPEWCTDLLGVHPAEHVDALDDLALADRRRATRLQDALARSAGTRQALTVLLRWIRDRRSEARSTFGTAATNATLDRIRAARSATLGFPALAEEVGLSERHLRRLIRERLGTGPKRVQRILRLNRAVALADATARPDWSRLAVRTGYYDQAHLTGEFRVLTGLTPTELHAERTTQRRAPSS